MSDEGFSSAWDAIDDTPVEAANLKLRSALMIALKEHIGRQGWTQGEAARRFGVTQPRVSDLMRGKIDLFGLDTLVNMAVAANTRMASPASIMTARDSRPVVASVGALRPGPRPPSNRASCGRRIRMLIPPSTSIGTIKRTLTTSDRP